MVAPSGPFDRAGFDAGLVKLAERYIVRVAEDVYAREGFLAGTDARRSRELRDALEDDEVDAIVCARGGYGAARLLPELPVELVQRANKTLVGFSDITALHALWARAGVRSIHASMVAKLGTTEASIAERWFAAIEGAQAEPIRGLETIREGRAEGILVGGNLAVLVSLLGTPYAASLEGRIVFLEDIGERPYRVDRLLTQLCLSGALDHAAAVVLGAFTESNAGPDGVEVEDVLKERLGRLQIPVLMGVPAGHLEDNLELHFGSYAAVDSTAGTLRVG